MEDQHVQSNNPSVSEVMVKALGDIGPWVKFLSITGFVSIGFLILVAIIALTSGSSSNAGKGLVNLGIALIYFFPCLFLYRVSEGITAMKQGSLISGAEKALVQFRNFWKYCGILTMISLGFLLIILLITFFMPYF